MKKTFMSSNNSDLEIEKYYVANDRTEAPLWEEVGVSCGKKSEPGEKPELDALVRESAKSWMWRLWSTIS